MKKKPFKEDIERQNTLESTPPYRIDLFNQHKNSDPSIDQEDAPPLYQNKLDLHIAINSDMGMETSSNR